MSRQIRSTEQTRLITAGNSGAAARRFKARLIKEGWTTTEDFKLKPGFLYTVVRAISARVNQNYDGWPSDELKKSYKTFLHKPVFVNHENHDPTKARGVVVAARYVENGMDKYIEVVQEIDAGRFPKLAHEIKTGGLDSVSMGAEAGFTICSYCHNKATDMDDMCDHVLNHKGKTLTRFDRRTGKKEDVLVFESCHKISFFELSYVFEPADETAVASKVVVAGRKHAINEDEDFLESLQDRADSGDSSAAAQLEHHYDKPEGFFGGDHSKCTECGHLDVDPDKDPFDPREFGASRRTADGDITVPAPPGTPTIPQSVIDNTPVINLNPATELTGQEAPGVPKSAFAADIAEITKLAGDCPPGMDCSRNMGGANEMEQIGKDTPNNPVNQVSYTPGNIGDPGSAGGAGGGGGTPDGSGVLPGSRALYDQLMKDFPGADIGGYRPAGDGYDEHAQGALDFMTKDEAQAAAVRQKAFDAGAPYVLWKQQQWDAPWHNSGGVTPMETRAGGDPTQNHFDHVHIAPLDPSHAAKPTGGSSAGAAGAPAAPTTPASAQRAAGKYTKEDFANAGGKKPWETDTPATDRAPVEDADLREIEAMIRQAEALTNPEHAQDTTRRNTIATYLASHAFLNGQAAPKGHSLDFGAGWGDSANHPDLNTPRAKFHTLEPYPNEGMVPDFHSPDDIDDGTYSRIHNLNVVNVAERHKRDDIVRHIGRILAPGGHAVITARGRSEITDMLKNPDHAPGPDSDPGSVLVNGNKQGKDVRVRYQKGFHPDELHQYVQSVLGDGYTVRKVKVGSAPAAVHIVRHPDNVPAQPPRPIAQQVKAARAKRKVRSAALRKVAHNRAIKLAWGEQEAPMAVDTLREEGSAPEDDNNDFERYVDPPKDLQTPDLSQAAQIDRQQELQGAGPEQMGGVPGAAEGGPAQDQGQYITLKIPMPNSAPQVPQQAAPPVAAPPAMPPAADPTQQQPPAAPPQQIAASLLDYFDNYYGRRIANWLDAIEANRGFTPEESADYRRQAAQLSTLQNGRGLSTTGRNPQKGTANMARHNIASRTKVATAGRRQHFAEGPLVDGGDRSRNDQGEQEEAFISQTPPFVEVDFPDDDTPNISNTEHNLVARVQQGRAQLMRDAQQLASLRQRRAFDEAGGPTAEIVDPTVNTGREGEKLTGDDFISADPNDGVVPTNPKDASLRAFQAFDGWLAQKTGKSSRRHREATIKKAAAQFSREAGISPQALFPALGIVLREARKNDKKANTKGAAMRKRADEKLEVAAPDGRIDVESPVENVTSAEAQASQFDLHDFGDNAGDNIANPDLSTDQNWAPGEASGKKASIKTAGGLLAMRCAEGMIAAGLEPNSRERKYQLAAEFEQMNRGLIQDRVALLERFAAVRQADLRKVASGSSRGAARSPIPAGLGGGTRTAAAPQRLAAHDPRNDSSLFI